MNNITLAGYVSYKKDLVPVERKNGGSTFKIEFNIGVNAGQKVFDPATGQNKNLYEYHKVEVWGKSAEYTNKWIADGNFVIVSGSLRKNTYTDRNTQQPKTIVYINAQRIEKTPGQFQQEQVQQQGPIQQFEQLEQLEQSALDQAQLAQAQLDQQAIQQAAQAAQAALNQAQQVQQAVQQVPQGQVQTQQVQQGQVQQVQPQTQTQQVQNLSNIGSTNFNNNNNNNNQF